MAKNRTLFLTDYCLTPHVHIPNAGILCEEKKIIAVGGASAFSLDEPGLHVIDLTDAYATPASSTAIFTAGAAMILQKRWNPMRTSIFSAVIWRRTVLPLFCPRS